MSTQTPARAATDTTQAISPAAGRFAPSFTPPLARRFNLPLSLVLALCLMAAWFALRLGLWVSLGSERPGGMDFMHALLLGGWFDAWSITYLLAPLFLLGALLPNRWRLSRVADWGRTALLWLALALLLFGVVSEIIFWQEFTTRFNFIAVDYLIYTHEVLGNIWESYPIPAILLAIALSASLAALLIQRVVRLRVSAYSLQQRFALVALALGLPLAATSFANLDQAASPNHYAEELAGNGLFSLAAAMRRNELEYQKFYATEPAAASAQVLAQAGVNWRVSSTDSHLRKVSQMSRPNAEQAALALPEGFARRPKNIVLITVESLSAEYLDSFDGKQSGLTPQLDKLAAAGLKFSNIYATGTRTVRGLEALSLGTPPIPGQAIIHRPGNSHLATLGEQMRSQGLTPYFIYGGYGYFDNMNNYFRGNDYKVIDRTDFPTASIAAENIWGVADESLFANTLVTLDQAHAQGRPFMAQVMTTSNHRPYTFPAGRVAGKQGTRSAAVSYTDYAIGEFIRQAQSKPWFKDTLFVIVADHCASVAGKTSLPVAKYRIPLILYAPDLLKPGVVSRMASQIDIAPTLMQVMGMPQTGFFGASMLAAQQGEPRAFISNYQDLGYYKHDQLIVLSPRRTVKAYAIDPHSFEASPIAVNPQLASEAIAYYQTADHAFKQGLLHFPHPRAVFAQGAPRGQG